MVMAAVLCGCLLAACESAESQRILQVRTQLVGTWQFNGTSDGEQVQRTVRLGQDGKFTDTVRVQKSGEPAQDSNEYGGEWSYDGNNLKRRYMSENGRKYSGGTLRYSTFPLTSVSSSELVLQDNIAKEERRYQRLAEG